MPLLSIRHYAPPRGLFIARDPVLSEPRYQYLAGMPTWTVDASGRFGPQVAGCLIGMAISGGWDIVMGIGQYLRCKDKCAFWCDFLPDLGLDLVTGCFGGVLASLGGGPLAMSAACIVGAIFDEVSEGIGEWCKWNVCWHTPREMDFSPCRALMSMFACVVGATVAGDLAQDALFGPWLRENWRYLLPILQELGVQVAPGMCDGAGPALQ